MKTKANIIVIKAKSSVRSAELTYKAITVVTGLTTVYCKTPSLHLNSKTLQKNAMTWIKSEFLFFKPRMKSNYWWVGLRDEYNDMTE